MTFVLAHSLHLLEPALFGGAVAVFGVLVVRERRRGQAAGAARTEKEFS
jgi:hypothetical protein